MDPRPSSDIAPLVSSDTRKPSSAQPLQQLDARLLRQRLAAGHANVLGPELANASHDGIQLPPLTAMERIGGIAVLAPQRAAGEPYERGGDPRGISLALQGIEDFGELESRTLPPSACVRRHAAQALRGELRRIAVGILAQ